MPVSVAWGTCVASRRAHAARGHAASELSSRLARCFQALRYGAVGLGPGVAAINGMLYAGGGFRFGVGFSPEWLAALEAYQP